MLSFVIFIRITSVAGKGIADHNSFKEAVYTAIDIYNSRNQYLEISKNPMKTKEKQL